MHIDQAHPDDVQTLLAVGTAIRSLRKDKGLSQEELSHRSSIDRSHMGRIERGERNLTMLNLVRISRGLECPASDILKAAGF
jgi:transcriptional regulator with XRE-family HTH domain